MGFGISRVTALLIPCALLVSAAGWATGAFLSRLSASSYELWKNTLSFDSEAVEGLAGAGVRWTVALLAVWVLLAVSAARRSGASLAHTLKPTAIAFAPLLTLFCYVAATALGGQVTFASLFVLTILVGLVAALQVQILTAARPWAEPSSRQSWALVAGGFLLFLLVFGALDILGCRSLFLGYHDTGIYAEALWNTLRGEMLKSNHYIGFTSYLGDHFAPILFALVPLYALAPYPQTLLLAQTALLAAGAIPVFLLARNALGSAAAGGAFALAYLLYPALEHANLNLIGGFNPDCLSIPPLLCALLFLPRSAEPRPDGTRVLWLFIFLILALGCKETVAVVVLMIGLYAFVWRAPPWLGAAIFALGLVWFLMAAIVIIPHFSGQPYWHAPQFYGDMGASFTQLAGYLLAHPLELLRRCLSQSQGMFLLHLLVPLGLLPLLAPTALLIGAPTLVALLSAKDPSLHSILLHYRSSVIPVLFFAAIEGARRQAEGTSWIQKLLAVPKPSSPMERLVPLLAFMLATSLFSHYFFSPSPVARPFDGSVFRSSERADAVREAAELIPPSASLSASDKAALHFTRQADLWVAPKNADVADFVLLDLGEPGRAWKETYACRDQLLRSGAHGVLWFKHDVLLFKKGHRSSFDAFIRVPPAEVQGQQGSPVNEFIECLDARVHPRPEKGPRARTLTVLWRCAKETDLDFCPLIILEPSGEVGRTVIGPYPMLHGIHPTFLWKPGDAFRENVDLELPFAPPQALGLGRGIAVQLVEREHAPIVAKQVQRAQER